MANNFDTHILLHFRDKDTSTLVRASDGMCIAGREKMKVAYGEDPRQQQQRVFIDKEKAVSFLRKIADADQRQVMLNAGHPEDQEYTARIEDREADKRILTASNVQ